MNNHADEKENGAIPPLHESVEGINKAPDLNTKKNSRLSRLPIYVGGLVVLAFFIVAAIMMVRKITAQHEANKLKEAQEQSDARHSNSGNDSSFIDAMKQKIAEKEARLSQDDDTDNTQGKKMPAPTPAAPVTPAPLPAPAGAVANTPSQSGHKEPTPAERKLAGDVLMNTGESSSAQAGTAQSGNGAKDGLDSDLEPSQLAAGSVSVLPDQHYLLSRGTIIPCVLQTKIITTYKGMTECQVTEDIYSSDGSVVLFERGSEITGEQRSALMQGQARIFVLWSRVRTPNGVIANINSSGTDSLGASGQEAWVDGHWWERFGNGILLSVIDDGLQAAANSTQDTGNNNDITYDNTSQTAENMATEALKNSINIPPTAYNNQGALLNVFVSRDIDFREIYRVH